MPKSFIGFAAATLLVVGALTLVPAGQTMAQYVQEDTAARPAPPKPDKMKPARPFLSRLSPGGNFGAAFGTYSYLDISPMVTYAVTDRLSVGPGITYIYASQKVGGVRYSSQTYGARALARFLAYQNFYVQGEVEGLNILYYPPIDPYTGIEPAARRIWIVSPLIGAGMRLPLGQRSGVFVTALYNLNYKAGQLYPSPFIFRIGLGF